MVKKRGKGTPFPTGLFKSQPFLERVAEMLGADAPLIMARHYGRHTARKAIPRVALANRKEGNVVEVIIGGKSIGRFPVKGKGTAASSVILPKMEASTCLVSRARVNVPAVKVLKSSKSAKMCRAAKVAMSR